MIVNVLNGAAAPDDPAACTIIGWCGRMDYRRVVTVELDRLLRRLPDLTARNPGQAATIADRVLEILDAPDGPSNSVDGRCEFEGRVAAIYEHGRIVWECPTCGAEHHDHYGPQH